MFHRKIKVLKIEQDVVFDERPSGNTLVGGRLKQNRILRQCNCGVRCIQKAHESIETTCNEYHTRQEMRRTWYVISPQIYLKHPSDSRFPSQFAG